MKKIWKLRVADIVSVTGTHVNIYQILLMGQPYPQPAFLMRNKIDFKGLFYF